MFLANCTRNCSTDRSRECSGKHQHFFFGNYDIFNEYVRFFVNDFDQSVEQGLLLCSSCYCDCFYECSWMFFTLLIHLTCFFLALIIQDYVMAKWLVKSIVRVRWQLKSFHDYAVGSQLSVYLNEWVVVVKPLVTFIC